MATKISVAYNVMPTWTVTAELTDSIRRPPVNCDLPAAVAIQIPSKSLTQSKPGRVKVSETPTMLKDDARHTTFEPVSPREVVCLDPFGNQSRSKQTKS